MSEVNTRNKKFTRITFKPKDSEKGGFTFTLDQYGILHYDRGAFEVEIAWMDDNPAGQPRSENQIRDFLSELSSPDYQRSGGGNMGYEYQATVDTLEWVLGIRECQPLAGRRF